MTISSQANLSARVSFRLQEATSGDFRMAVSISRACPLMGWKCSLLKPLYFFTFLPFYFFTFPNKDDDRTWAHQHLVLVLGERLLSKIKDIIG